MSELHAVTTIGLRHLTEQDHPTLYLQDEEEREIHIAIGLCEANAIRMVIDNETFPRPLTHDLLLVLLEEMHATVDHVIIDDISNGIYYCRLVLNGDGGETILDCRPSDGVALALRARVPILISDAVTLGGEDAVMPEME